MSDVGVSLPGGEATTAGAASGISNASAIITERGNLTNAHAHYVDNAGDVGDDTVAIKEKKLLPVGKKGVRFPAFERSDLPLKSDAVSAKERVEWRAQTLEHLRGKLTTTSEPASKTTWNADQVSVEDVHASHKAQSSLKLGTGTSPSLLTLTISGGMSSKKGQSGTKGTSTDSQDTVFLGLVVYCPLSSGLVRCASDTHDDNNLGVDENQGIRTEDISMIRLQPFKVTVHDLRIYVRVGE
jgi:hypothetical protein